MAIGHFDENDSYVFAPNQPDLDTVRAALYSDDPIAAFEPLFEAGLDANYSFGLSGSLLYQAIISSNSPPFIGTLLTQGALPSFPTPAGTTHQSPLSACSYPQVTSGSTIATLLLSHPTSRPLSFPQTSQALFSAARELRPDVGRVILHHLGADRAKTALNTLADETVAKPADVEFGLGTPAHELVACAVNESGDEVEGEKLDAAKEFLKLVVEFGADLGVVDAKGRNVEALAEEIGADELAAFVRGL